MNTADRRKRAVSERRQQPTMPEGDYPIIRDPCARCGQPIGRLGPDGVPYWDGSDGRSRDWHGVYRHHQCAHGELPLFAEAG